MLTLAFIAIVIAILCWSGGTAMLLWASRLRRREALAAEVAATADPVPPPADVPPAAAGVATPAEPTLEEVCRDIVADLGDVELKETALMLTALAEHGRVMVASRDPGREELARRVVDELEMRSAEHGMGPPITASDGEVAGAAVFRAVEGVGAPLLTAAEWELTSRSATGASSRDAAR